MGEVVNGRTSGFVDASYRHRINFINKYSIYTIMSQKGNRDSQVITQTHKSHTRSLVVQITKLDPVSILLDNNMYYNFWLLTYL